MFTSVQMSPFWAELMLIFYHPCCIVILLQHWWVIHPLGVAWITERDPWVFGRIIWDLFEMTWKWNCKYTHIYISPSKDHKCSICDQYVNAKWSETKTGETTAKIPKTALRLKHIKWFVQFQSITRMDDKCHPTKT
jgi:hypothetical protein